jgi:hypothetical protein
VAPFVPANPNDQKPLAIPGHSLFWLLQARLDLELSGRQELTPDLALAINRLLANFEHFENREGLLENLPNWNWLDWSPMRVDGAPVSLNALYAQALDAAADLLGRGAYREKAAAIRATLNRSCPGLFYPDTLLRRGDTLQPSRERGESTQYFALWCGVPPPERERQIWEELRDGFDMSVATSPSAAAPVKGLTRAGTYPFLQRLQYAARHGDTDSLIRNLRASFGPQLQLGPGTLWEHPGPYQGLNGSFCQGVTSGVGVSIVEGVLGIRPQKGLQQILIQAGQTDLLKWCRGTIPAGAGQIAVSWACESSAFSLSVDLPTGCRARVVLGKAAERIWKEAPSRDPWPETIELGQSSAILVRPGAVQVDKRKPQGGEE